MVVGEERKDAGEGEEKGEIEAGQKMEKRAKQTSEKETKSKLVRVNEARWKTSSGLK